MTNPIATSLPHHAADYCRLRSSDWKQSCLHDCSSRKNIRSVQDSPISRNLEDSAGAFLKFSFCSFSLSFHPISIKFYYIFEHGEILWLRLFLEKNIGGEGNPSAQRYFKLISMNTCMILKFWKYLKNISWPRGNFPPPPIFFKKRRAIAISHRVLKHSKNL